MNHCYIFEEGCETEASTLYDWYSKSDYVEPSQVTSGVCTHFPASNYFPLEVAACDAITVEATCQANVLCYWSGPTEYLDGYTCIWSGAGQTDGTNYAASLTTDHTLESCHNYCNSITYVISPE